MTKSKEGMGMAIDLRILADGTLVEWLTDEDAQWDKTNEELEDEA